MSRYQLHNTFHLKPEANLVRYFLSSVNNSMQMRPLLQPYYCQMSTASYVLGEVVYVDTEASLDLRTANLSQRFVQQMICVERSDVERFISIAQSHGIRVEIDKEGQKVDDEERPPSDNTPFNLDKEKTEVKEMLPVEKTMSDCDLSPEMAKLVPKSITESASSSLHPADQEYTSLVYSSLLKDRSRQDSFKSGLSKESSAVISGLASNLFDLSQQVSTQTQTEDARLGDSFCRECRKKDISSEHKCKYVAYQAALLVQESPYLTNRPKELNEKLEKRLQTLCQWFDADILPIREWENVVICDVAVTLLSESSALPLQEFGPLLIRWLTGEVNSVLKIAEDLMEKCPVTQPKEEVDRRNLTKMDKKINSHLFCFGFHTALIFI